MCGSVFAVLDASGPLAEAHVPIVSDQDYESGRHLDVPLGLSVLVPRFGHAPRGQVRNEAAPELRSHPGKLSGLAATVIG